MRAYAWAQAVLIARRPVTLAPLLVTPLYTIVLFSIAASTPLSNRLATSLTITATVMTIWAHSMFVASEIVDDDRYEGTLEVFLSAPSGYITSLVVRVLVTAAIALPAFLQVAAIGALMHGTGLEIRHPLLFAIALLLMLLGTAGSALALGALLLLVKGARTLQNAVTYPFYLLAGLVWPIAQLPDFVQPVARAFYLSWAVEALRSFAADTAGGPRALAMACLLTAAVWAMALVLLQWVLRRLRTGSVALHG